MKAFAEDLPGHDGNVMRGTDAWPLYEWTVLRGARDNPSGVCMTRHSAMDALSLALIATDGTAQGHVVPVELVDGARGWFYLRYYPQHTAECQAGVIRWR